MARRFACALGVYGVLALTTSAVAAETTPIRVSVEAPRGCTTERRFYDAVRARTDLVHLSSRSKEAVQVEVVVVRARAKFRGELRIIDRQGQRSTRRVTGGSCEEVVRALSLTAALAVDQIAEAPPNGPTAVQGKSQTTSEANQLEPRTDEPRTDEPRTDEPRTDEPRTDEPRTDEPRTDEPRDEPVDGDVQPFAIEVGAQGLVSEIISPRVSVGGALFAGVGRVIAGSLRPMVGLAVAHIPADFAVGNGDISVRWTALILSACPLQFQPSDRISIQPCVTGTGGRLQARSETSETAVTASRSWWSAGLLARSSFAIGGGTAVRLELGLSVPLLRRRFITTPPDEVVGESPSVSALAALGLAHGF